MSLVEIVISGSIIDVPDVEVDVNGSITTVSDVVVVSDVIDVVPDICVVVVVKGSLVTVPLVVVV